MASRHQRGGPPGAGTMGIVPLREPAREGGGGLPGPALAGQDSGPSGDKTPGQTAGQTTGQAAGQTTEHTTEHTTGQSVGRSRGRPGGSEGSGGSGAGPAAGRDAAGAGGAATLRAGAELLAAALPPLLAEAEHLAQTVLLGAHGRRRSGQGDEFWQYRPAMAGDTARSIDWRRSARSDAHFIREKEWQAAQSVVLWVDEGASMRFVSGAHGSKEARANLLAMAVSVLLMRGGERVALVRLGTPPQSGALQLLHIARGLSREAARPDYGAPQAGAMQPHSRAVFFSDFLGDIDAVVAQLTEAADRGVKGALVQVLDVAEESFPYDGRTVFESMQGTLRHETLKAGDLRDRYQARLAERKDQLMSLARATGWQYLCHHSDDSAQAALLWLYAALERRR
jgi:uncharacterized protein (DUF58 family)